MKLNKQEYIHSRMDYHRAVLAERHPDIPAEALGYWAEHAALEEYRTGRVYADPPQVETGYINVFNPKSRFGSGEARGISLRFNPGGPMVSIISLSYAEGRELAESLIRTLRDEGEWHEDDYPAPEPA